MYTYPCDSQEKGVIMFSCLGVKKKLFIIRAGLVYF